jgi:hypothetical protein
MGGGKATLKSERDQATACGAGAVRATGTEHLVSFGPQQVGWAVERDARRAHITERYDALAGIQLAAASSFFVEPEVQPHARGRVSCW